MSDPSTVSELIDWFEREFCCLVGPARSWIEIPVWYGNTECEYVVGRWYYETWVVKIRDDIDYERKLVSAIFEDFKNVPRDDDAQTILFWRYPEKIKLQSELKQLFSKPLATVEAVEDRLFEIPPSAILNTDGDCYCEDAGRVLEWTLRTRLCINFPCGKYPPMLTRKAEGAVTLTV